MNYFFKGLWASEIVIDILISLAIIKGWGFCSALQLWSLVTAHL